MTVFCNNIFFKRATIDADTDRDPTLFSSIHNSTYTLLITNVARINTNLICPVFNCRQCQTIVKMNVCDQRNMDLLMNLFQTFCRLHCWYCTTDNITAGLLQRMNLCNRCCHILCLGIRHRLNCYRIATTDLTITYLNHFCLFTHLSSPILLPY